MATVLLVVIYIAFIGLGVPDSLFGTAWPAMGPALGAQVADASFVTVLISAGTVASSLMSARLIARFGPGIITAASTLATALALLGFSCAGSLPWLCLMALPLGLGAGAIDAALNNYVALHYKAAHTSFISCFYGVGVTLSPYLMSLTLSGAGGWRGGYRLMAGVQGVIVLLTAASLPLWKRNAADPASGQAGPAAVSLREQVRDPTIRLVWLVFMGSCAIEYTCNNWGGTFLTEGKGMTPDEAARMITLYYIGMTAGRFLSGLVAGRVRSWRLIGIGQGVVAAAVLLLLLPLPVPAAAIGLFLVGLGNGPVFPNLIYLTPRNFGRDRSQAVMGTQMAAANTGILLLPPVFGLLAQGAGAWLFPHFLLALALLMCLPSLFLVRRLRARGRYE